MGRRGKKAGEKKNSGRALDWKCAQPSLNEKTTLNLQDVQLLFLQILVWCFFPLSCDRIQREASGNKQRMQNNKKKKKQGCQFIAREY